MEHSIRKTTVVITSISGPNKAMKAFAEGCLDHGYDFIVIGDRAGPPDFELDGCAFYSMKAQKATGFKLAELCPESSYSRKNVGYMLAAAANGSGVIIETDDDNLPLPSFWNPPARLFSAPTVQCSGWANAYSLFTDRPIWPRGLPLDSIKLPAELTLTEMEVDAPIQQGLADHDPDTDAVFRMVLPGPFSFDPPKRELIALDYGAWCPFNSQNTVWFKDAFVLMYLPAFVSFRMCDIWRSLIAQRIAWENGWRITFHAPTVYQERNKHDLMKDFALEVPGYLNNRAIAENLMALPIRPGIENIPDNMMTCYEEMVRNRWVGVKEIRLLEAWFKDYNNVITP